jgi:kinesin family member 11
VYNQFAKQVEIFDECVQPTIEEVLQGYSATVFAYGQTGTGKTHTMEGEMGRGPQAGIIPRSIIHIFSKLEARAASEEEFEYSVRVSFLEVYNEQLFDLFGSAPDDLPDDIAASTTAYNPRLAATRKPKPATERLKLVEDSRRGIVKVQNLEEVLAHNAEEAFDWVSKGLAKRQVAETKCNAFSSRSHGIFTIQIHSKEKTVEGEDLLRVGKLHLVDLAGSECVGRSGATDKRLREAGNINQSLLTLGRVITALVEQRGHIPYRDSKLTRLLQDSLGGRTKTTIIATLSPSGSAIEETLSTLEYALRARSIKNRPEVNQRMTKRQLLKDFSTEIDHLRGLLSAAREKDGVYLPASQYEAIMAAKMSAETQLEELHELRVAQEDEITKLQGELDKLQSEIEDLTTRAEAAEADLEEAKETIVKKDSTIEEQRVDIENKGVIIDSQSSAHAELLSQASGVMTSSLRSAVEDVAGLHAKVERTQSESSGVRSTVSSFRSTLEKHLSSLAATSDSHARAQAATASETAKALRFAADASLASSKEIVSQVGAAEAEFTSAKSALLTLTSQWSEANQENAEAFGKHLQSKLLPGLIAATDAASAKCEAAIAKAGELLSSQMRITKEWSDRVTTSLEAQAKAWETFANNHTAVISRTRDQGAAALDGAIEVMAAQAAELEAFRSAQVETQASLEASLQSSIQSLITDAFGQLAKARDETIAKSTTVLVKTSKSTTTASEFFKSAASKLAEDTSSAARKNAHVLREASGDSKSTMETVSSTFESATSVLTGTSEGSALQATALVRSTTKTSAASVEEGFSAWRSGLARSDATFSQRFQEVAKESSAAVSHSFQAVQDRTHSAASFSADSLRSGASSLETMSEAAAATNKETQQWAASRKDEAAKLVQATKARPATGATPTKKDYVMPRQFAAPSPHARVLSRVEARRSANQAVTPSISRSEQSRLRATEVTPVRLASDTIVEEEASAPSEIASPIPSVMTLEDSPSSSSNRSSDASMPRAASPPVPPAHARKTTGSSATLGRLISKASSSNLPASEASSPADSEPVSESSQPTDASDRALPKRPGRRARAESGAVRASSRSSTSSNTSRGSNSSKLPVRSKRTSRATARTLGDSAVTNSTD